MNGTNQLYEIFLFNRIYEAEVNKQMSILSITYLQHVVPFLDVIDLQKPSLNIHQTNTTHRAYKGDK